MDQNDGGGSTGEPGRPLGRGLADVSHLFLSRRTGEASASDRAVAGRGAIGSMLRPAPVTREGVAAILPDLAGGLEDGLRVIDAHLPCQPCGEIDLLAMDRTGQLTIIDFETTVGDGLLLRGIGHFDWVARNLPIVQRLYQAHAVNFSLPTRLFLLAPQFSPSLRRVIRHIIRPQIHWVRYHPVEASGGPTLLFEPVVGE